MKVLLVYPQTPETFWSFRHVLRLVSKKAAFPPLGLLTVAAMLPDDWDLRLVDMNVEPLRDDAILECDWVFVSAMLIHKDAVVELARRCRALGKPVLAGGPLFTANPDQFPEIRTACWAKRRMSCPKWLKICGGARCNRSTKPKDVRLWRACRSPDGTLSTSGTMPPWPCNSLAAAPTTASFAISS
jgi:hypothetical protein